MPPARLPAPAHPRVVFCPFKTSKAPFLAENRSLAPAARFPEWFSAFLCPAAVPPPGEARRRGAAEGRCYLSVAYITALIVCMRFSASSKTRERGPSNTLSATSISVRPNCSAMRAPVVVLVS